MEPRPGPAACPFMIRIGCSGWNYRHWRGAFYPEKLAMKRWFAFYAEHFGTVEINNSFYRLPKPETVDGWRTSATEHPGCWWPDWDRWLSALSGEKIPARKPGDGKLKVLGDAPGDYVKVKSR